MKIKNDNTASPIPLRFAGYSALFLGNVTCEYLKTRKQMGSDSTYGESFKRVITEKGQVLKAPALQMILRLTTRSTLTAIAASTGTTASPEVLSTVETLLFTPVEHYRMYAALNKDTPCFVQWANKMSLSNLYRGMGAVATRQWSQWTLTYGIRDSLNKHTDLTQDQSTLAAVTVSSAATMPCDIVRNIMQDPKNSHLTPTAVVREVVDCAQKGSLFVGARARTSATMCNVLLSLHIMKQVETTWKEKIGCGGADNSRRER